MSTIFGSARHDENGKYSGGKAGDQTGTEVSMQTAYMHSKGWVALRPKSIYLAEMLAKSMKAYCNDLNIGYDQSNRLAIMSYNGTGKTECDCSSLVRRCIKDCSGVDVGNFTTANESYFLTNSKLFDKVTINSLSDFRVGDVGVTKTKGHTIIVVDGTHRAGESTSSASGTETTKNKKASETKMPTIKKGSKGNAVKIWQIIIGVDADGDFGSKTLTATKKFQKAHNLEADGIVGTNTWIAGLESV